MRFITPALVAGLLLASAACSGRDDSASPTSPRQRSTPAVTMTTASSTVRTATPTAPPGTPTVVTATPSASSGQSGIAGLVTIGPTCPVERLESPCPDGPFEAPIQVLDESGDVIAEVASGADGRFTVFVPPGTYVLHPVSAYTPPSASDQTVVVEMGVLTDVLVAFDSGIR